MTAASPPRRGFLRSACRHCVGLGALVSGLPAVGQGVAAPKPFRIPDRFSRPAADTDEGGLWSLMDREESRLRRSPLAIHDAALERYLGDLTCRLTAGHCPDIRIHVMRTPVFNASMAPNGMMQVWSGLLLRVENEAQLAAIVGHELGHYLERHQLEQLRDAKDKAVLAQLVGLVGGVAGAVGRIGILASAFAFSREHEERADRLGMRLMQQAGYDGTQAPQVWENLLAELKITGGEDVGSRSALFATHPPAGNRRDVLLQLAAAGNGGVTGASEYQRVIAPLRFDWLLDELKRGQFEESLVLFDRLAARSPGDAQLLFARGEVRRLRGERDDLQLALDDLTAAVRAAQPPAQAFRSLGLVLQQRADQPGAARAFEQYLALAPDAPDAAMIRASLSEPRP
ncbi:M48 family metallopeptidase [Ramlibacter sp.]|uniref:M48 family metallopeptidase n=1 Tax=Ramlibacter sp. TaxID=1917967 RepID=UPI002BF7D7BB|nr:M48 family metallopeptidase [Ramlibacter sp.]HWI80524.1 M48 family metallopeptidase [Ramlibacter sp.]